MKSSHGDTATSENDSCTSCAYTGESDRLSVRRLRIVDATINRLFRENYITSREIKLVDKLVKGKLLSVSSANGKNVSKPASSSSINDKTILKPKKFARSMEKELKETERNSDIFAKRRLVDKGVVLRTKKLCQCCSCGSCRAKARFHKHAHKGRRQKCAYNNGHLISKSYGISNTARKNNIIFETKNIKSEPCTCTSKIEQRMFKKYQPSETIPERKFLGMFSMDEHMMPIHKSFHHKSKRSVAYLTKKSKGKFTAPVIKLSQSISKRDRDSGIPESTKAIKKKRKLCQYHKQNPTDFASKHCLCSLKIKAKGNKSKSLKHTFKQEKIVPKHSYCQLSRIFSAPNVLLSPAGYLHLLSFKTDQISREHQDIKSKSVYSSENHLEIDQLPCPTVTNYGIVIAPDDKIVHTEGHLDYNIHPNNSNKDGKESRFHKVANNSNTMKSSTNKGSERHMFVQQKVSQLSGLTAKSGHVLMKQKWYRYLRRLKQIKFTNRTEQILIPERAPSVHQYGSKTTSCTLSTKQIARCHIQLECDCSELVHETESQKIRSNKSAERTVCEKRLGGLQSVGPSKGIKTPYNWNFDQKKMTNTVIIPAATVTIHDKNYSVTGMLQEDSRKLAAIKNRQMGLHIGSAMKHCFCTLKLHKKGRNAINRDSAGIRNEYMYPEENVRSCKECPSKGLKYKEPIAAVENKNKNNISSKAYLKENIIDTKKLKMCRKPQANTINLNKTSCNRSGLNRGMCALHFLQKDAEMKINASIKNIKSNVKTVSRIAYTNNLVTSSKISLSSKKNNNLKVLLSRSKQWYNLNEALPSGAFSASTIEFKSNKSKRTQSYFQNSQFNSFRLDPEQTVNISSRDILSFESKFNFALNCPTSINSNRNKLESRASSRQRQKQIGRQQRQLTGILPLLRRCYCTMNIKIANRGQTHAHKLEPYECEPGVCVPYECDPIECQKLIRKRLIKKVSTMSETRTKNRSSSSSTTGTGLKTKRQFIQSRAAWESKKVEKKTKPAVCEYPPQCAPVQSGGKQAVRVGSTFSFDIEFSKTKKDAQPIKSVKKEHRPSVSSKSSRMADRKLKSTGTRGIGHNRHDMETQSVTMKHKTSGVGPVMKRCFCTLKLQKKGRQQAQWDINRDHGTSTPPTKKIVPVAMEAGQNTKQFKPPKVPKLLPYECEPGICVPGQCDPHVCLELINKRLRKNKGTDSIKSNIASSSSMTAKKKLRTKRKHIQSRQEVYKPKKLKSTEVIVKPISKRPVVQPRSRKAVRIGSTLSFNIEFYKSTGVESPCSPICAPVCKPVCNPECEPVCKPVCKAVCDKCHDVKSGPKTKDKGLKGKYSGSRSRDSQAGSMTEDRASGVGPMLKRCFCTLKFHQQKEITRNEKEEIRLLATQSTATPVEKHVPDLHTRSTMTAKKYTHKLLPYECEPGVCVPGSCDPYECEERIKKRLINRATGTEHGQTRSVSSSAKRRRKIKDIQAQQVVKEKKPRKSQDMKILKIEPKIPCKPVVCQPCQPSRQAVRIGSTLSFNVEFYKDGGTTSFAPCEPYIPCVPSGPCKPCDTCKITGKPPYVKKQPGTDGNFRDKKNQRFKSSRDMDSQVLARKMRSTMTSVSPFLKRCFCTLKLQKPEKLKLIKPNDIATETEKKTAPSKVEKIQEDIPKLNTDKGTRSKKAPTHGRKLEPYECEPGVCIPGECDPHECLKRIKRRELRSKYAGTDNRRGRSVSSLISESSKSRAIKTQVKKESPPERTVIQQPPIREHIHRQRLTCSSSPQREAVRIGSCFSFNVEFYKDNGQTPVCVPVPEPVCAPVCKPVCAPVCKPKCKPECRKICQTKKTETQSKKTRSMASGGAYLQHAQAQSHALKTESRGSGVGPALKRCFCTLKLQKFGNQQQKIRELSDAPKHIGTSPFNRNPEITGIIGKEVGTKTKKERVHVLESYECEPGFCIPGQCDPYECLKRIQQRKTRHMSTGTKRFPQRTMSSLTSRDKKNSTKIQKDKDKDVKVKSPKPRVIEQIPRPSRAVENINRQAVRFGSNFSFNIEFYKDDRRSPCPAPCPAPRSIPCRRPICVPEKCAARKSTASISTSRSMSTRNKGFSGRDKYRHHRKSQAVNAKTESKGSGMGPLLKRCFCTVTLQRASIHHTNKDKIKRITKRITKTSRNQYDPVNCNDHDNRIPKKYKPYEFVRKTRAIEIDAQSEKQQNYANKHKSLSRSKNVIDEHVCPLTLGESDNRQNKPPNIFNSSFSTAIIYNPMKSTIQLNSKKPKNRNISLADSAQTRFNCVKQWSQSNNLYNYKLSENKSSVRKIFNRQFGSSKLNKHSVPLYDPKTVDVGTVGNDKLPFAKQEFWVQYHTRQSIQPKNCAQMKTLLPYCPGKFNKKSSRSTIPNNSLEQNLPHRNVKTPNLSGAKRLTVKNGKKTMVDNQSELIVKKSTFKDYVCRCMNFFSKNKNKCDPTCVKNQTEQFDGLNESRSKCQPKSTDVNTFPKKSRVTEDNKGDNRKRKFSRFQCGDVGQIGTSREQNSPRYETTKVSRPNKLVRFSLSRNSNDKKVTTTLNSHPGIFMCPGCGGYKINKDSAKAKYHQYPNMQKRPQQQPHPKQCFTATVNKSCRCAGRCACPKLKCCCAKHCPCPHNIDATNHSLDDNTTTKKSDKTTLKMPLNFLKMHNLGKVFGKEDQSGEGDGTTGKKCVCGSIECSLEAQRLKELSKRPKITVTPKKCDCGSKICGKEIKKTSKYEKNFAKKKELLAMKKVKKEAYEKQREMLKKQRGKAEEERRQAKNNQKYKAFQERQERYKKEDEERKKKRIALDKKMLKDVEKYKNSGDCTLMSESVLDIAKLGFVSAGDIARCAVKAVIDPKYTCQNVKSTLTEPNRAWTKLKGVAEESPGIATLKRVKMRLKETSCVKGGKRWGDRYPATHFLLHVADKNPKDRIYKAPKDNKVDFQCSPYMLSLRKRPCLGVYLCCPWFYPHCMSLLNVWKQFTDILLFLLAVAVWSPCILCMEACRALMCCFLCTG